MGVIIVLADDEPELRAIYSACLRAAGHEVWEASDGEEAVDLVIARKPSLLILDVWMPRVNGFEVLERLRQASHCSNLRVVMLSNLGDSDTRLEGFAVGVADYWIKGLSLADLRGRVERLMADIELSTDPG
jgi:two-component system sensor histidine kinase ChiS